MAKDKYNSGHTSMIILFAAGIGLIIFGGSIIPQIIGGFLIFCGLLATPS